LYRIATRVCLTALESRRRRPLPSGLGGDNSDPAGVLDEQPEVPWLEPVPDALVGADPAAVVTSRESIRLALIATLQHLPPRQRAVLILRDVLRWKAAEVAKVVGTTTAAVNSILQRARARLDEVTPAEDTVTEPTDAEQRELLDKYVTAFERKDIPAIVELFTQDAVWEMPPFTGWYSGPRDIGRLIDTHCPAKGPGDMRLLPAGANGQPAFGLYLADGVVHRAFQLHVLTLGPASVAHVVAFNNPGLFARFGLPEMLGPR
jgi:RNA polymerase sigma-70 factor (ECF subfamily)